MRMLTVIGKFIDEFHPEGSEKWQQFKEEMRLQGDFGHLETYKEIGFVESNFAHALANFTDTICKLQKENCAKQIENDGWSEDLVQSILDVKGVTFRTNINKVVTLQEKEFYDSGLLVDKIKNTK